MRGSTPPLTLLAPPTGISGFPLALPAVEAADESAEGIAHEEEELLSNRHVSQPCGVTMQVNDVRESRPSSGTRPLRTPDGVLDCGAAGLADVKEVHGHRLPVVRSTQQGSDSAFEPRQHRSAYPFMHGRDSRASRAAGGPDAGLVRIAVRGGSEPGFATPHRTHRLALSSLMACRRPG